MMPSFHQTLLASLMLLGVVADSRPPIYVHFDLKGAPPKPDYFNKLLVVISNLGADGIVIEWEDMFPFTGKLESVRNGNAYSMSDVISILQQADNLGLKVIPLVQTLGHLEWVLKTEEFAHLREDPRYPQVACIGMPEAQYLILDMVNQVLSVHAKFSMPFFHIGADEVQTIGVCEADKQKMAQIYNNSINEMLFDHIKLVASNITEQSGQTTVLVWFDEFKTASPEEIQKYSLDTLVVPVVWKYTTNLDRDLPLEMWRNLSRSFSSVWGASAFKGADGSNRIWNRVKPYVQNNKQWFLQSVKYTELFSDFQGLIMTGWQRYDHFASLCEFWPVSMASLAINIKVLQRYIIVESDIEEIFAALNCPNNSDINALIAGTDSCRFPGYQARSVIRNFYNTKTFHENSSWVHVREAGWLQTSQMLLSASNAYNLDKVRTAYEKLLNNLNVYIPQLRKTLNDLYYPDVVEEFLTDYVIPFYSEISTRRDSVVRIDNKTAFRPRPWFPVQ